MELEWLLEIQNNLTSPVVDQIMIFISSLGNCGLIWIALGILLLLHPKWRYGGVAVLLALAASHVFGNMILKDWVARPRPFLAVPEVVLKIVPPHEYSFPSGHTITAFAAVFALPKALGSWRRFLVVLAVAIGISRLYLFVHYPSDVMAGALFGIVIGKIVAHIMGKKQNKTVDNLLK